MSLADARTVQRDSRERVARVTFFTFRFWVVVAFLDGLGVGYWIWAT